MKGKNKKPACSITCSRARASVSAPASLFRRIPISRSFILASNVSRCSAPSFCVRASTNSCRAISASESLPASFSSIAASYALWLMSGAGSAAMHQAPKRQTSMAVRAFTGAEFDSLPECMRQGASASPMPPQSAPPCSQAMGSLPGILSMPLRTGGYPPPPHARPSGGCCCSVSRISAME